MSPELQQFIADNDHLLQTNNLKDFYTNLKELDSKLKPAIPLRIEFCHYAVTNNLDYELLQSLEFVPEKCYSECKRNNIQIPANVNTVKALAFKSYAGDIYFQGDEVYLKSLSMLYIDSQCKIHTKPGFSVAGSETGIKIFKKHQVEDL